jgi:hypothetical protein
MKTVKFCLMPRVWPSFRGSPAERRQGNPLGYQVLRRAGQVVHELVSGERGDVGGRRHHLEPMR